MESKKPLALAALPEERLLEYVVRLGRFSQNRHAMHIHLSSLKANYRKDHNLRIAAHMFDTYLGHSEGELFQLSNGDFIFISRDIDKNQLTRLIDRLRGLFSEDPLLNGNDNSRFGFCTWYDINIEYSELVALSKNLLTAAREQSRSNNKSQQSLDPGTLLQIEKVLSTATIGDFVRNQAVCLASDTQSFRPIFDELYVSIEDLRLRICPEHTLTGDKWLFQYFTQLLDRRMLQHLSQNDLSLREGVVSINLNISTVLSAEFLEFDSNLTARTRGGRLVIEIQKHDIFADMGAYVFAQQYLHERTHRLALDGITYQTLPFIDQAKLHLDLIKLGWSPEIADKWDTIAGPLKEDIQRCGPEHFILTYCDCQQAIDIGHELGITMYQGRHVSNQLQKKRSMAQAH